MKKDVRSRGWCFTVNNYTDDDMGYLMALYEEDTNMKYMNIGFEKAGRTQTPHIQGYCYYTNAISKRKFEKRMFINGRQCHVEAQKAKLNVAGYVYCMEDYDYHEMGEVPRQGHRTDLEYIRHKIIEGRPIEWVADNYFSQWVYHKRSFEEYRNLKCKYETKLFWYDHKQPMQQIRKIMDDWSGTSYYIVTDIIPYLEICKLVLSRKYQYIFVPNLEIYADYDDDFDGAIC